MDEKYSISETARRLLVHRSTLHRWIDAGLVPKPNEENIAGSRVRYWNKEGFAKVKEYREKHFGEGRGERTDIKKKRMKRVN
jgi:predicted site-specific integrase-resolvase